MSVNIKVAYENIPTGSMANSTTTISYPLSYSPNFVNFNDFKTQRSVPKYATLEPYRCLLDGSFYNVPDNPKGYGYISSIQSDVLGKFSDDIIVTRTYSETYSSPRNKHRV